MDRYRVFVVTNADKKRGDRYIFSYDGRALIDKENKRELGIEEIVGARCR